MYRRLILICSLVGMGLTLHLWVQKARGFDQGCWGLGQPAVQVVDAGCTDPALQAADRLLGVPISAWGFAFYFALAVFTVAQLLTTGNAARRLRVYTEIMIGCALIYSGYLIWFQASVGAFCLLCLCSAGLVLFLSILSGLRRLRHEPSEVPATELVRELGIAGLTLFTGLSAILAGLLFVDKLGLREPGAGGDAAALRQFVGRSLPQFIDGAHLREVRACRFDTDAAPLAADWERPADVPPMVTGSTGPEILVFFDPHCPHCRNEWPEIQALAEALGTSAQVFVLPRRLWAKSNPAITALTQARATGQYYLLWDLLLTAPRGTEFTDELVVQLWTDVGLDPALLRPLPDALNAENQALRAAGVKGTPAVFIDRQRVQMGNLRAVCLETLATRNIGP